LFFLIDGGGGVKKIDRKYQVVKTLGEGMGGVVFLAEVGEKRVALKQLQMEQKGLSSEEILENFKREFSLLKELNHPHIVRILDFGFDRQENFYYFTTEYIEGSDIFTATRGLSSEEIEEYFVQILRALSYLHSHRVCHLDIKPLNILVGQNDRGQKNAKLIDFGISAFRKQGVLAGTPAYLAPETLLGERLDGRADLYSLGVSWYECLTGQNPFRSEKSFITLDRQRTLVLPHISTQSSRIPPYLDPIFEKLLRKNPAERYHHADQVIRDLNWSGSRHYPLETEATALAYLPGEGKLVGREAEWSQLISFFDRVFLTRSDSKCCVLLSGTLGTGKSRLLKELKYHAQLHGVHTLNLTEVSPSDLKGDTLLLADNADAETLEKATQWIRQFHTHSILIVLAGPNLKDLSETGFTVSLNNFDRFAVAQYIASVLGVENPPDFLVDELFSRSEGNPLFLTELLNSLILSHQVFDEQGRWSPSMLEEIGVDFNKLLVPKTLDEYCRSKYENLPAASKQLLATIALTKAPLERTMIGKLGLEIHKSDWDFLQRANLVGVDPYLNELRLLNPSLRDWIPHHVEPQILSRIHQALGDLFLGNPSTEEAAWFHLGLGRGERGGRFQYLLRYGDALYHRQCWLEAARVFDDAFALAPTPENQVEGHLRRARALFHAGRSSEALVLLEETQRILKKERENPEHWRWVEQTFREMGVFYLKAGRFDLARESLQSARVLLEEHEENTVELMILDNLKGSLLMREGKLRDAAERCEETYQRWQTWPQEMKKQVQNNELASIYMAQGKKKEAKALFQAQTDFYQEIKNFNKKAYAIHGWAESCYGLSEFEESEKMYQSCVELARKLKNEELLFHAFNGLGNIAYSRKDWTHCVEYYRRALELAQHHSDSNSSVAIAINLAIVFRHQGDSASAYLYLRHVIDTLEAEFPPSIHQLQFLTHADLELGKLCASDFKWFEAWDAYRDASRLIRHHPTLERFYFAALSGLVQTAFHLGRTQEAQTLLTELEKRNLSDPEKIELEELKRNFCVSQNEPSPEIESTEEGKEDQRTKRWSFTPEKHL
jgi:tetratricopeptide (TPR) repeat protein/tRNA A-37 threonylcarbamoyl transferase component Bud32